MDLHEEQFAERNLNNSGGMLHTLSFALRLYLYLFFWPLTDCLPERECILAVNPLAQLTRNRHGSTAGKVCL